MKSLHPYLSDDHEALLKTLELGEETPLELHESARWIFYDDASHIAFSLLTYLWDAHPKNQKPDWDYHVFGKLVARLGDFNADTADAWWKLAWDLLLYVYPKPESIPELAALVTAPSKRRSPGRMKQAIFYTLKARFCGFARPHLPDLTR